MEYNYDSYMIPTEDLIEDNLNLRLLETDTHYIYLYEPI